MHKTFIYPLIEPVYGDNFLFVLFVIFVQSFNLNKILYEYCKN